LIGLNNYRPELFKNIDWGSHLVFQQTVNIAQTRSIKLATLEKLADIDMPEDLADLHACFFAN